MRLAARIPIKPEINITGGTKKQRLLVQEAADFYLRHLLTVQQTDGLIVDIELVKGLFAKEGYKADVGSIGDDDENEFELRIDSSMNLAAILLALAHECVHIKQYVSREMRETNDWHLTFFKNKLYDTKKLKYFDFPWEIEAYGREDGLLYRFVSAKKLTKARWYTRDPDFL